MQREYFTRRWFVVALLAGALLASRAVAACEPVPFNMIPPYFTYTSPDGRLQFRAPYGATNNPDALPTGMYRSDDVKHPLWTVNWREVGWHDWISVANDGVHVARMFTPSRIDDPAFTLYAQDKAIATFRVRDLVTDTRKLHIPPPFDPLLSRCGGGGESVPWLKNMNFDGTKGLLSVMTVTGEQVDIALASGKIVRRIGAAAPQVTHTLPQPPKGGKRFVVLRHTEKIRDMVLPPGTVVTENSSGSWIKSATLSRSTDYRGTRLAPGTVLNLSNAPLAAEIVRHRSPRQESDKDHFADMEPISLQPPDELSMGTLRIKGFVFIMRGVGGLGVACMVSGGSCRIYGREVALAEFWPDMSIRHLVFESRQQPLPVRVGGDVLRTYDVWYWPNGQVNLLSFRDDNQRFRGEAAGNILRFWDDGRPQWWAGHLYCRNGSQASPLGLQPDAPQNAVAACSDDSIYYMPRKALCNNHPEVAIQTFDFLKYRRPSVFQECREPLPDSVGAGYIPVFVQNTP